jgi:hypothetical protein
MEKVNGSGIKVPVDEFVSKQLQRRREGELER